MRWFSAYMLFAASVGLGGCGGGKSDTDGGGSPDGTVGGDDTSDTADDGGLPVVDLEPAALGIAINTGMTADMQLTYYMYGTGPDIYAPYLVLSVADVAYFSLTSDDPERQLHVCEFYASFPHVVATTPPIASAFDYEAGSGSSGESIALWFFAEGSADIFANAAALDDAGEIMYDDYGQPIDSPACASLKQQGYPDILDGMHVGVGFGDLTSYLYEEYWGSFTDPELAEIEPSVTGMYVAINHPSTTEPAGYDFVPYDWGSALFFEATVETFPLYDAYGTFYAPVAMATVTADNLLVYGTPRGDAFVRGIPYWFEDYPNLDLSLLKEGVPATR